MQKAVCCCMSIFLPLIVFIAALRSEDVYLKGSLRNAGDYWTK